MKHILMPHYYCWARLVTCTSLNFHDVAVGGLRASVWIEASDPVQKIALPSPASKHDNLLPTSVSATLPANSRIHTHFSRRRRPLYFTFEVRPPPPIAAPPGTHTARLPSLAKTPSISTKLLPIAVNTNWPAHQQRALSEWHAWWWFAGKIECSWAQ
jgi:hypothetical protein